MPENIEELVQRYKGDIDIFIIGDGLGFGDIGANEIKKLVEEDVRRPLSFTFTGAELKKTYLTCFPATSKSVNKISPISRGEFESNKKILSAIKRS